MNSAGIDIGLYLKEGLVAVEPVYVGGLESYKSDCLVHTLQTSHRLHCTMRTFTQNICGWFHVDLSKRNKAMAKALGRKRNIPLALSEELILIKIKTRTAARPKDETNALVNADMVIGVSGHKLQMKIGERFGALAAEDTILDQLILARTCRLYFVHKRAWLKGVRSPGIR